MSERFKAPSNMRIDDVIAAYDGVMEHVDEVLKDQGISSELPEPIQPDGVSDYIIYADNGDPTLPEDLTGLDNVSIGKLFTFFTNWANYVQSLVTSAECARDVISAKLKTLKTALTVTYQEADPSLSDRRAANKVTLDPRFVGAETSYMKAFALAKTLNSRFEQLKRSEKVISRELTRRQQELEALVSGGTRGGPPFQGRGSGRFSQ
jgi:hypothetical protein